MGLDHGNRLGNFVVVKDVARLLLDQRQFRRTAFQGDAEDMHRTGGIATGLMPSIRPSKSMSRYRPSSMGA